jgi:hypothetical protein
MIPQADIEQFAKTKRPRDFTTNTIPLNVEYRCNNKIVHCYDDFALDFFATYWTALKWTTGNQPEHRVLILANRHAHAQMLLHETIANIHEADPNFDPLVRSSQDITNDKGGSLYFTVIGCALMGRQFDQIVINDAGPPRSEHEQAAYREFLEFLPMKLAMSS